MSTIINLFGGPGSGKTTMAAALFHELKILHYSTEIVSEFAKDMILEHNPQSLDNQFYITGNQAYRQWCASLVYDYVIIDSPILLGAIYNKNKNISNEFNAFLLKYHNEFNNINIYIKREENWNYNTKGRLHNIEESLNKDKEIYDFLVNNNIEFYEVNKLENNIAQKILKNLLKIKEIDYKPDYFNLYQEDARSLK
jgi:adenylate kinase family enzyme